MKAIKQILICALFFFLNENAKGQITLEPQTGVDISDLLLDYAYYHKDEDKHPYDMSGYLGLRVGYKLTQKTSIGITTSISFKEFATKTTGVAIDENPLLSIAYKNFNYNINVGQNITPWLNLEIGPYLNTIRFSKLNTLYGSFGGDWDNGTAFNKNNWGGRIQLGFLYKQFKLAFGYNRIFKSIDKSRLPDGYRDFLDVYRFHSFTGMLCYEFSLKKK